VWSPKSHLTFSIGDEKWLRLFPLIKHVFTCLGLEVQAQAQPPCRKAVRTYVRMVATQPRSTAHPWNRTNEGQMSHRYLSIDKFASTSLEFSSSSGSGSCRHALWRCESESVLDSLCRRPAVQLCLPWPMFQDQDQSRSHLVGSDPLQAAIHAYRTG
jgi:hypothetical protein